MESVLRYIAITLFVIALAGCGITASSRNEGFADLDSLGFRDVDRTFSMSIGPAVLRFAAHHIEEDPTTREVVSHLDGVRVQTFDVVGDEMRVAERIDRMSRKLEKQDWIPFIKVRDGNERAVMLLKIKGDHIAGLTVISTDEHEAVIINVMGELRPGMFAHTMMALDMDAPEFPLRAGEA